VHVFYRLLNICIAVGDAVIKRGRFWPH